MDLTVAPISSAIDVGHPALVGELRWEAGVAPTIFFQRGTDSPWSWVRIVC
jgi:hypothetical protein